MHDDYEDSGELKRRFAKLVLVFSLCFVVLLGRLFFVQIVRGDEYRQEAMTSFVVAERLPARRGEVKDRNGVVLARNIPAHRLRVVPDRLIDTKKDKTVADPERLRQLFARLVPLLELTHETEQDLLGRIALAIEDGKGGEALTLSDGLVGETCPFDGHALTIPEDPDDPVFDASKQLFCRECGLHHEPIAKDAVFCPHDRTRLEWKGDGEQRHATCPKCKRHYATSMTCPVEGGELTLVEKNLVCSVCKRRFVNQVAIAESKKAELPGVILDTALMREYTQPFTISHILGYMNNVNREDLERSPGVYRHDDRVGRAGVEAALEAILRGKSGRVEYLKGTNREVETDRIPSEDGLDVWLTIDARLQREVRDILRYQRSAAAVVMDPQTGEILAMYSHPGFDPNAWSGGLSREEHQAIEQNPYGPMFNKALTAYAPGSVFKIVTALAGLRERIVTPETTIHCPGHYTYGGRDFGCHAKQGHGHMDMVGALKGSCDVYFYQVAEKLGMDKLAEYARKFGFGEVTGLEVAESRGIVPTRAWYAERPWMNYQPGLVLSVGIGQGSLTATPLQVARSFAIMANGGRMVTPRIVSRYSDPHGVERQDFLPVDEGRLDITPEEHALIHKGLVAVVNDPHGTALNVKDDLIVIAGKTGTAEAPMVRPGSSPEFARWLLEDHAWFAMYAPAEDAQVVITVFIEHGGSGGKDAAPLARRIFDAWRRLGLYRAPEAPPELPDGAPGVEPEGAGDGARHEPDQGEGADEPAQRPAPAAIPTQVHTQGRPR